MAGLEKIIGYICPKSEVRLRLGNKNKQAFLYCAQLALTLW